MIRVTLFDSDSGEKYIEFDAVPLEREEDFRCVPAGLLPFHSVQQIAQDLERGDVSGWVAGYRWYRSVR
jgi:hypothetical protein